MEPQIHDPMLNQMEKPDCITSQDDIVWGFYLTPINQAVYTTLDTLRYQHCEAVVARPVEPQIYDPVLNQIERPDRIALQDGIIWRMCKILF